MEDQVKQEVIDAEGDRLPTTCDVFSIKREESLAENVRVDGSYQVTNTDVLEYEEIKIEEFDVDKALLQRERAVASQPVGAGQVTSRYLTLLCYEHSCSQYDF